MASFESSFDLRFESFDCFVTVEPGVDVNDASVFSDKIGGGHSLGSDFGHELLGMIQDDREGCLEPFEELRGIGRLLVGSDRNDEKATAFIFLVEFLVGRKGLATGAAPGGPEVVEDNLAFCCGHGPGDAERFRIGEGRALGGLAVAHRKSDDE